MLLWFLRGLLRKSSRFLNDVIKEGGQVDNDKMFEKALRTVEELPTDEVFFVKELFQTREWKLFPKGDKLGFGKYFKDKVKSGRVPNVEYCGKAANNSAQYRKI